MSTKTSIKRIAAVAAVALTLGGFSAVSANAAAVATATFSTTGAYNTHVTDGNIAATATATADGSHYVTVTLTQPSSSVDSGTVISSAGVGTIYGSATASGSYTSVNNANGTNAAGGFLWYGDNSSHNGAVGAALLPNSATVSFNVVSAAAGTQTITATPINGTSAASTLTITWGSAPVVSAGYTAAASFIDDGSTRPSAANTAAKLSYSKAAGVSLAGATTGATIAVNVKDDSNTDMSGVGITASIAGPGLLTLAAGSSSGSTGLVRSASLTAAQMTTSHATIGVSADGTSGTATITVSAGTTTLFTKTVTFYGTVATLTATQNLFVAKASSAGGTLGSSANADDASTVAKTPAVEIVAKDANGFVVPNLTITGKSSDVTVISSSTVTEEDGTALTNGANGKGYYIASVTSAAAGTSGKTATVTFRTLLADGVTYISAAPLTFTLGGTVAGGSVSAAFADSEYAAGTKMSLVVSAKDSAGNAPYDGQALLSATATSNVGPGSGSLPGIALETVNGKATATFYAPIIGTTFTVSAYSATTAGATAAAAAGTKDLTAVATVTGANDAAAQAAIDAAQEATDAANAAYDAANNAMDSADAATAAAQDAADNASAALAAVTSLSATVAKLVKSVAAIAAALAKVQKKIGA